VLQRAFVAAGAAALVVSCVSVEAQIVPATVVSHP